MCSDTRSLGSLSLLSFVAQLPVLGAIRMQMLKTARAQLDSLLGDQIARFLGEYAAEAAEDAATYLLSEDTEHMRKQARRKAAEKLLSKPIGELVQISDLEMALVRDAVWSAVQEFRLPNEEVENPSPSPSPSPNPTGCPTRRCSSTRSNPNPNPNPLP